MNKYGFLELGFGSREKNGFGRFGSKKEEGIWGLVQERRRDLGVWFGSREKKGFRVLIQHRRKNFG